MLFSALTTFTSTSGSIFFTIPSILLISIEMLMLGLVSSVSFFETKSTEANVTPSSFFTSASIFAAQFAQSRPSSKTTDLFPLLFSALTTFTSGSIFLTMAVASSMIPLKSFSSATSIVNFLETKSTDALLTLARFLICVSILAAQFAQSSPSRINVFFMIILLFPYLSST